MNSPASFFLAALAPIEDLRPVVIPVSSAFHEAAIVLGAILLLVACLVLAIALFRRPFRHWQTRRHRRRLRLAKLDSTGDAASHSQASGRHRRRRRRLNPTLAETGGLPPIRRDPPDSASQPQSPAIH